MDPVVTDDCAESQARFDAFSTVRWLFSAIAICAYCSVYEWYLHGHLLHSLYMETPFLWRPSMKDLFPFTLAIPFTTSLIIASAYRNFYKRIRIGAIGGPNCPYRKSLKFGVWCGLLIGSIKAQSYLIIPIPGHMALAWFIASTVKGIGTGLVLCVVYQLMQPKAVLA